MSERPNEHDWKSCIRHKRIGGSNPPLSATLKDAFMRPFCVASFVVFSPSVQSLAADGNPLIHFVYFPLIKGQKTPSLRHQKPYLNPCGLSRVFALCVYGDLNGWESATEKFNFFV